MITLCPVSDRKAVKQLFIDKNIPYTEFSMCVKAECNNQTLGLCLFELNSEKITVFHIEPVEDIALADGILRSSLHVAAEHSVMNAFYGESIPVDFLKKINFIKDEQEKTLDIDKLFKSCCSCTG